MQNFYYKVLCTFSLVISLHFYARAQAVTDTVSRDYVINLKGDTIKGDVLSVGDGAVRIDPFTETHTVRYKAVDIKEVCKMGKVYTSLKISLTFRNDVILKRIEHGAINLYEYFQQSYNNTGSQTTWYADKPGLAVKEIKTSGLGDISRSERKKNMMALIVDNEQLTKQFIAQYDYSFTTLLNLIREYNKQAALKAVTK